MSDEHIILNEFMRKMVADLGGLDAASMWIALRWGTPISKGTLSRKVNGSLDWTLMDIIALQDAAKVHPVTDWMASQSGGADALASVATGTVDFMREAGEAIGQLGAVVAMPADHKARLQAIKEVHDVVSAGTQLIEALTARGLT